MCEPITIRLRPDDRAPLKAVVADPNSTQKHVWRSRIVLLSAAGLRTMAIARRVGKVKTAVLRWQRYFTAEGVAGLLREKTRKPGKLPLPDETVERGLALTLTEPPGEATHWTGRAMAKAAGISLRSGQRIWQAHDLAPHRIKSFKLSLRDVVRLTVDPPAHAMVLSIDEKSQIQALDRNQPGLPLKKGHYGTMTHDHVRHGTTTLFAALNVLEGTVIELCMQRHRHQEFLRYLNTIEAAVPAGKLVRLILDNYGAHKHPKVMAWLGRHPRFVFHFTPTSCSWLNAVATFFAGLTKRHLKRGIFRSVADLQAAINRSIAAHNAEPKPFTWTADPNRILNAVHRGRKTLGSFH